MLLSQQRELYLQRLRYRYLAYRTIRDALGFYLGIPKFLADVNVDEVVNQKFTHRLSILEKKKGRKLTDKEATRSKRTIEKTVLNRISLLNQDYLYCEDVLFNDNLWLQLLDVDPEFFRNYLDRLTPSMKDELAVVPNWTTRDHSLGRPYITDKMSMDF